MMVAWEPRHGLVISKPALGVLTVIMRLYCNDGSLGAKTWPCYI